MSQQGCVMVTDTPEIEATRQRLCIQLDDPLGWTNWRFDGSASRGVRQPRRESE
jgi:hypothetical protein